MDDGQRDNGQMDEQMARRTTRKHNASCHLLSVIKA